MNFLVCKVVHKSNKCHFCLPQIVEQHRVYVTFIFIGDSGDGKPGSQFLSCPSLNYVKQIQYFPTKGYVQLKLHEEALYLFLAGILIVSPVSSRGHVTCHAHLVTNALWETRQTLPTCSHVYRGIFIFIFIFIILMISYRPDLRSQDTKGQKYPQHCL